MRFKNKTDRTISFPTLGFSVEAGAEYRASTERQAQALRKSKHFEELTHEKPQESRSEQRRKKAQEEDGE